MSRAFSAPILGDAKLYLNGYRLQPAIVSFDDDSTWGQPDGLRYPVTNGNFLIPKGRLLTDVILERVENSMWRWQISDFRAKSMFFTSHAVATWKVAETSNGSVDVVFSYRYLPRTGPPFRCFGYSQQFRFAECCVKQWMQSNSMQNRTNRCCTIELTNTGRQTIGIGPRPGRVLTGLPHQLACGFRIEYRTKPPYKKVAIDSEAVEPRDQPRTTVSASENKRIVIVKTKRRPR